MYLKILSAPRETKTTISTFGGINCLHNAEFNSPSDMYGIAPECYPILSSGVFKHSITNLGSNIKGAGFYKAFYYFSDDRLWFDSNPTDLYAPGEIKSVVGFGNFLVIFPQKLWFNTDDYSFGTLENKKVVEATVLLSDEKGKIYENYTVSETRPEYNAEGDLWLDISGEVPLLKKYLEGAFYVVSDVAMRISSEGIGDSFSVGDSIKVTSESLSGSFNIKHIGEGFMTFGSAEDLSGETEEITVVREVPDITYALEYGNRIWGCSRSGTEIYASELGKKDCFYTYQGTAADSYAVSVGENTDFLGVAELSGRLYFFKSRFVYMLQGTKPQNFQLMRVSDIGINEKETGQVVSHKGYLYYFSSFGLMRFDGSSAEKIDKKLPISSEKKLICASGEGLYITQGESLYYIDTDRYEFYKMDRDTFEGLYDVSGILGYYNGRAFGTISKTAKHSGEYMVEFNSFGKKKEKEGFITRLGLSLYLGKGSTLRVEISYDDLPYREVKRVYGKENGFTFPLPIRRCATFKLRLSGKGNFSLYSVSVYRNEVG